MRDEVFITCFLEREASFNIHLTYNIWVARPCHISMKRWGILCSSTVSNTLSMPFPEWSTCAKGYETAHLKLRVSFNGTAGCVACCDTFSASTSSMPGPPRGVAIAAPPWYSDPVPSSHDARARVGTLLRLGLLDRRIRNLNILELFLANGPYRPPIYTPCQSCLRSRRARVSVQTPPTTHQRPRPVRAFFMR